MYKGPTLEINMRRTHERSMYKGPTLEISEQETHSRDQHAKNPQEIYVQRTHSRDQHAKNPREIYVQRTHSRDQSTWPTLEIRKKRPTPNNLYHISWAISLGMINMSIMYTGMKRCMKLYDYELWYNLFQWNCSPEMIQGNTITSTFCVPLHNVYMIIHVIHPHSGRSTLS